MNRRAKLLQLAEKHQDKAEKCHLRGQFRAEAKHLAAAGRLLSEIDLMAL